MANQHTKHGKRALQNRQDDAQARQSHWDALTPEEKLAVLDTRPGASKKERAKLS